MNIDVGSVEALHNLSKKIKIDEIYLKLICTLVLTLIKSNQYQRVKDLLHKYTIIQPNNAQVFCLMAHILQETHDFDQAKSWFVLGRMCINSKIFIIYSGIYKP